MNTVLLATDSDDVMATVDAAIGSSATQVLRVRTGREVRNAVLEIEPELVVLDLQIGSMGGIAACLDLRLEEGAGRLAPQRILLLLDRDDDVFLARRADADGWLVKPLEARRLEKAVAAVMADESYVEGPELVEG